MQLLQLCIPARGLPDCSRLQPAMLSFSHWLLSRWRRFRKGEVIFDTQGERAASVSLQCCPLEHPSHAAPDRARRHNSAVLYHAVDTVQAIPVVHVWACQTCCFRRWTPMQATSLHLLVEGVAVLTAKRDEGSSATSSLYSGYLFNLAVCNAFGVYIGLERAPIE